MSRWFPVLALLGCVCFASLAPAQEVTVLYFERAPYYYTSEGKPAGFLMDIAANVFREAGIAVRYEFAPPRRIHARIRSCEGEPLCAVGWFKVPEREQYALFSQPIYQDRPFVLVSLWENAGRFADKATLAEVFADHHLAMGLTGGFVLGEFVDGLRQRLAPAVVEIDVPKEQLFGMLAAGRFDYTLIAPEELDALAGEGRVSFGSLSLPETGGGETLSSGRAVRYGDFMALSLDDIPKGNLRCIMCSRNVGQDVMRRMDAAIRATVGEVGR